MSRRVALHCDAVVVPWWLVVSPCVGCRGVLMVSRGRGVLRRGGTSHRIMSHSGGSSCRPTSCRDSSVIGVVHRPASLYCIIIGAYIIYSIIAFSHHMIITGCSHDLLFLIGSFRVTFCGCAHEGVTEPDTAH